jgi:hypothetical protein
MTSESGVTASPKRFDVPVRPLANPADCVGRHRDLPTGGHETPSLLVMARRSRNAIDPAVTDTRPVIVPDVRELPGAARSVLPRSARQT